jgi:hypothetical protein
VFEPDEPAAEVELEEMVEAAPEAAPEPTTTEGGNGEVAPVPATEEAGS